MVLMSMSTAAFAQNCDTLDTGLERPGDFPSLQVPCGGSGIPTTRGGSPGGLTTIFAADNSFAGNTFDLENLSSQPIVINSFAINGQDNEPFGNSNTVDVYSKSGTSVGFENDAGAWTLMGSDSNVLLQAPDVPTPVNVGGLVIQPGEVVGIYIDLASFDGTDLILYTTGGPEVFTDGTLELTTNTGQGDPAFDGAVFFPRIWNGTVFYSTVNIAPPVSVPAVGPISLSILLTLMLLSGILIVRRIE